MKPETIVGKFYASRADEFQGISHPVSFSDLNPEIQALITSAEAEKKKWEKLRDRIGHNRGLESCEVQAMMDELEAENDTQGK